MRIRIGYGAGQAGLPIPPGRQRHELIEGGSAWSLLTGANLQYLHMPRADRVVSVSVPAQLEGSRDTPVHSAEDLLISSTSTAQRGPSL